MGSNCLNSTTVVIIELLITEAIITLLRTSVDTLTTRITVLMSSVKKIGKRQML
jgi:hypothetical protein